jgi:hypothetical protein
MGAPRARTGARVALAPAAGTALLPLWVSTTERGEA